METPFSLFSITFPYPPDGHFVVRFRLPPCAVRQQRAKSVAFYYGYEATRYAPGAHYLPRSPISVRCSLKSYVNSLTNP